MKKKKFEQREEPLYLNPEKFWRRLPQSFRLAFVSAFVMGLLAHLYVFSNLLINHDGIRGINTTNNHLTSGRWSLEFLSSFSGTYEMPVVIAILTVLALALCAGLTVWVLNIHSSACVLLVSGFMISFPTVACTFSYLSTADAYFIAAFLQVAAVSITKKFRRGWLAAILCIAVSLGTYQAFIGCSVALFLFDCILALFSDTPTKDVLKRGLRYIAVILAGLILYRVLLAFFLWKDQAVLLSYKGMSEAINSGFSDYLRTLPTAFRQIILFFWSTSYLTRSLQLSQRAVFVLAALCFCCLAVLKRIHKDPLRLFLLICGAALMPVALNLVCVICVGQTDVNILMQYSYVFAYVFALKLFEMAVTEAGPLRFGRARHAVVLTSLALCAVLVWTDVCVCNTAYLSLQLAMETSQATGIRVLSRLEVLEGYVPGETPVMLEHSYKSSVSKTGVAFPQLSAMTGFTNFAFLSGSSAGKAFLEHFCAAGEFLPANTEQCDAIKNSGVLDSMPAFPARDSIQWYDGVVVVKVS